jgi:hypothetical protein
LDPIHQDVVRAHAEANPAAGTAQWIADEAVCSTYNPTDQDCVEYSDLNCKIETESEWDHNTQTDIEGQPQCKFDELGWVLSHSAPEKAAFIKNFIRHYNLCKEAGNGGDENADTTYASCSTLADCEYIAPVNGGVNGTYAASCIPHWQLITEALPEVEACFSDVVDAAFMYQGCHANIHEVGFSIGV